MKVRNILTLTAILVATVLIFNLSACKNDCNIPAPDTLIVDTINLTTAQLTWSAVNNAGGYHLTVIDTASNNIITDTTLSDQGTTFTINDLIPGNTYSAEVTPLCEDKQESTNSIIRVWTMPSILIGDVVIMMERPDDDESGGTHECVCSSPTAWETDLAVLTNWVNNFPSGNRRIIEFEITNSAGTIRKYFKLAFTENCTVIIALNCGDEGSITELPLIAGGYTEPIQITLDDSAGSPYIEITSSSVNYVRSISISTAGCTGCTVRFRECTNPPDGWTGACDD